MSDSVKPTQVPGESAQISGVDLVLPSVQPPAIPPEPAWMGKDTSSSASPRKLEAIPEQPFQQKTAGETTDLAENASLTYSNDDNEENKLKKSVNLLSVILTIVTLSLTTFLSLSYLNTRKDLKKIDEDITADSLSEEIELPPLPPLPARPDYPARIGDFALSVNGEILSWDEYEKILDYELKQTRIDVNDPTVRVHIKDSLVQRLLIFSKVKELGIVLSKEDLTKAEMSYFGHAISEELRSYPETQKKIETQAYKEKITEKFIRWLDGGFILIEMGGPRVEAVAKKKGVDPKELSMSLIKPYHERAKKGESMKTLIEEIKGDQEFLEVNRTPQSAVFERYTKDSSLDSEWEDPNFYEILFSLLPNETSDIFVLRHPNDKERNIWVDYGYCFIKVEQASKEQIDYFKDWLEAAKSQAQINSNI